MEERTRQKINIFSISTYMYCKASQVLKSHMQLQACDKPATTCFVQENLRFVTMTRMTRSKALKFVKTNSENLRLVNMRSPLI